MRLGFFAYPWDLLDEGPEAVIEQMAGGCHCDSLLLNALYHHARLLRPRWKGAKVFEWPEAAGAFVPVHERYRGLLPRCADQRLVDGRVLARAREACARRGMDFGLWVVGLHNSTLGRQRPELTMRNCFGDQYDYALCPSSEAAQLYLRGLVDDLVGQFAPGRIIVEAIGHMGMRHGTHHEMFFVDWSEALELLLSLCFCDGCSSRAAECGVDVEALRLRVCEWAEVPLRAERSKVGNEFRIGEVALLARGATLSAGLNACDPDLSGSGSVAGLAGACKAAGCQAIYYYNYGLLTEERLDWVAAANQAVRE
jgi:hypothetical protein